MLMGWLLFPSISFASNDTTQNGLNWYTRANYVTTYSATTPNSTETYFNCGISPDINYNWGSGTTSCFWDNYPSITNAQQNQHDYYDNYWIGWITAPYTGTISFYSSNDDGFKLNIDSNTVINSWAQQGNRFYNGYGNISMVEGQSYYIQIWHHETGGGSVAQLYWGWTNHAIEIVPTSALTTVIPTIAPYLNPPTNLQVNVDTSTATVHLTWSVPETSNASVLTYAISWSTSNFTTDGWGWTHDQTNVDIPFDIFRDSSGWNKNIQFRIRADNNTLMVYSDNSTSVEAFIPDPTPPAIPIQTPDTNTVTETQTVTDTQTVTETQTATETQTVSETSTSVVDTSTLQTPIDSQTVQETVTATETSTATSPVDPEPSVPVVPPSDPSPPVQPIPQPPVEINPRPVPTQPVIDPTPAPEPTPDPVPVEEIPEPTPEPDPIPVADTPQDPIDPQVDQDNNDQSQVSDSTDVPTEEPTPVEPDQQIPTDSQDSQTSDVVDQPVEEPLPTSDSLNDSSSNDSTSDPDALPETEPKLPPVEKLVPHVQVDQPGVTNGGIEFFGTKSQPQVIGEDGQLTPPPPPPGSGLPIPPDAITTADTFIGQPGGTTFNAPDIAVPVILTPLTGAVASIPGAEALNEAFVALSNIGNDMSPITRKKAKKILVITALVSQVAAVRRKF